MTSIDDAYKAFREKIEPQYQGDPGPGPITALGLGTELIEALAKSEDTEQTEAMRIAQIQAVGTMIGGFVGRFTIISPRSEIRVNGIHSSYHPPFPKELTVHLAPPEASDPVGEPDQA
jgi:hypothetical protein